MSKRCSARTCFNSQMTNKTVHYFCFPKHAEFARQWAIRAQREDLTYKPLPRINKYYLCSAHFTSDCFADPPDNTKLLRTLRPYFVPMPSLFAAEADYGCNTLSATDGEALIVGTQASDVDRDAEVEDVLCYPAFGDAVLLSDLEDFIICQDEGDDEAPSNGLDELHAFDEMNDALIHTENGEQLCFKDEPTGGLIEFAVFEELADAANVAETDAAEEAVMVALRDMQAEQQQRTCRLCASLFEDSGTLIDIYAVDNIATGLVEDLDLLLPNVIQPLDGRPQQICTECYTKSIECARIIRQFQDAQRTWPTGD